MNKALLSSQKMDWCTPQAFFDVLNEEFRFKLDAAATDKTAKCAMYYTPETDGLNSTWNVGGAVFCNPPYGRELGKWVRKAHEEARGGGNGRSSHSFAHRYKLFPRLHIRASGNSLLARKIEVHRRRRKCIRSRALPFYGCCLQREGA